jgi:hypothetical protein
MVLIAQIALGVIIGGLTLALLVTSFILWVQQGRSGNARPFAIGLFIAAAVIVVVLVAVVAIQ